MKKPTLFLFLSFLLFNSFLLVSQNPDYTLTTFCDLAFDLSDFRQAQIAEVWAGIEKTPTKNEIVVVGNTNFTGTNAFIAVIDNNCNLISRTIPNDWDRIYDIIRDGETENLVILGKKKNEAGPYIVIIHEDDLEMIDDPSTHIDAFDPSLLDIPIPNTNDVQNFFPKGNAKAIHQTHDGGYIVACESNQPLTITQDPTLNYFCTSEQASQTSYFNTTYLVKFDWKLNYDGRSTCLNAMNEVQSVTECGDYYLTTGQFRNGRGIFIASFKSSLFVSANSIVSPTSDYIYNPHKDPISLEGSSNTAKSKGLVCTPNQNGIGQIYVSGRIEDGGPLKTVMVKFSNPGNLVDGGGLPEDGDEYLTDPANLNWDDPTDETDGASHYWYIDNDLANYGQNILEVDDGWLIVGETIPLNEPTSTHSMSAIMVKDTNPYLRNSNYLTNIPCNVPNDDDQDVANFAIELSNGKFAIFGKANQRSQVGQAYIAILNKIPK